MTTPSKDLAKASRCVKEEILKEFDNLFPRHTEIQKQFICSALDRYAREVIEKIISDTFQNTSILEQPDPYKNKVWLGWNLCRLDIQNRAKKLLDK